jgi:hypothetical protein
MKRLIYNLAVIGFILLMNPLSIRAQLFEAVELYPNINEITRKYYSGTGGRGYWSVDYMDSIGRIIKNESYYKKHLTSKEKVVYDENNNVIFKIQTSGFCNSEHVVDTLKYEYKYEDNQIVYQLMTYSDNISVVTKLVENQGDTLCIYNEQTFCYRPKTKTTDVFEKVYKLRYQNGLLVYKEVFDKDQNSTEIKKFEYFKNGRLKRRLIVRIPEPEWPNVYCGGPGSDDEYYEYKLDSEGRVKVFYKIVDGKKYKIAVYKYRC